MWKNDPAANSEAQKEAKGLIDAGTWNYEKSNSEARAGTPIQEKWDKDSHRKIDDNSELEECRVTD